MASVTMPPGPTQRQLLSQIRGIQKDAPGFLLEMARQYGPLAFFKVGSLPVVIVSHPDGVRQILQDHNRQYSKDTIQYNALATITGRGLLTSDGDFWLRQRRLAQGAFSRSRLASLGEIIVPAVSAMLDRWEGFARRAEVLDVDQEMMRLALEIVGKALFRIDLSREAGNLTQAVLTALDHIIYRARNVIVPPDFLPTPRNLRFRAALRRLDQAVYAIIDERRAAPAAQDDLLGMLLAARDEETGEGMNNLQVRDEVITMLIAGHETVASALTWTWYLLSSHPQIRSALHDESALLPASQSLQVADLDQFPIASQVFSEALRLYPPAWVITRKAIEPDELFGYSVPSGSLVILSPYVIYRQPDFWQEPESFDPLRFSTQAALGRNRFAYIPFGAGPRLCIGNQFASIESQMILALVSQRFWLELAPNASIQMDALVTLRPRAGMPMLVRTYPV